MKIKNFAKIILLLAVIFVFPAVTQAQLTQQQIEDGYAECFAARYGGETVAQARTRCCQDADWVAAAACKTTNSGGGVSGGSGVLGSGCSTPGAQSTCGQGLICGNNSKCIVNLDVPDTGTGSIPDTGNPGGSSLDNIPGANPEWCNNDPNLTYSNGVCLPKDAGFAKTGFAGSTSLSDLMIKIIKFFLTFAGIVGVLILVIGGYWYLSSGGNEETAEKGKKAIINAIIGLVVVILAYTIVTIISSTLIADTFVK